MGAVCCCLQAEDFNYVNLNSSVYRNCMCLRCFVQNFLNVYTLIFRRGEMYALPSSVQGETSFTSTASLDNSLPEVYRSPPRPLPYDADIRRVRLQRDGLVSRREKGTSYSNDDLEPLRGGNLDSESERLRGDEKRSISANDKGSKDVESKAQLKLSSSKSTNNDWHVWLSSEDEDVCPTCLEDYTSEDPKIMTKCSHHFHLGCIYEWMERSENCPVCGKEMEFDETL